MNVLQQADTHVQVHEYLQKLKLEELSPLTIQKYEQCLKVFVAWLQSEPITEESAKRFLNHLKQQGYKRATQIAYYHALKPFLATQGIVLKKKFKKQYKLPEYHAPDKVKAILNVARNRNDRWSALSERDSLLVLILAHTGMRRAEILSLKVKDVNFYSMMIRVYGKGGKERMIPINKELCKPLKRYTDRLKPSDLLFPIRPANRLSKIIKRYADLAGIDNLHTHSLRHYFATQVIENYPQKDALRYVQQLLGHSDISTTAVYLDVNPRHLTDAVSCLPNLMTEN